MNSMTGYGKAVVERGGKSLTIELKSVNHRFLAMVLTRCSNKQVTVDMSLAKGYVEAAQALTAAFLLQIVFVSRLNS